MAKKAKTKKPGKGIVNWLIYSFISVVILIVLFLILFVGIQIVYADKVLPGVKVAGLNLSGKTYDEAQAELGRKVNDLGNDFKISTKDNVWQINSSKIGLEFKTGDTASDAYSAGRNSNIFFAFFNTFKNLILGKKINLHYALDEAKLENWLKSVAKKVDKPAVDPTLKFDRKTMTFVSVPGQEGLILDLSKIKEGLFNNLYNFNLSFDLVLKKDDIKIHSDDLEKAKKEAEILYSKPLVLKYDDRSWKIDTKTLASFIIFVKVQENGDWTLDASLNRNRTKGYLTVLFKDFSYPASSRVVIKGSPEIVMVQGRDGFDLNFSKTISAISKVLFDSSLSNKKVNIIGKKIPKDTVYLSSSGVPNVSGHAIVIKLGQQILYCYNNGKLLNAFYCSTGIPMFPTPSGVFSIYAKTKVVRMRGDYGPGSPYNYDLPNVPNNCWFSGNYAIHGCYWHSNFGTVQSHGCVNLSLPNAEWVYNWARIGDPVYIY